MADGDSTTSLHFPSMVGGVRSAAPPRTLVPGSQYLYRDSLNMQVREGRLIGRPGIVTAGSQPPSPPTITGVDTVEIPAYVNTSLITSGLFVALVTKRILLFTTGGGWVDATPTYAVGTVSATNGSGSITGAGGTLWVTRGITLAYITIDGADYQVLVTGEAAGTITPVFAGATGAGKAYVIKRVLVGSPSAVFCVIYNQNLYVGGNLWGATRPAVIKVANVLSATPTTTIITGSQAYETTTDAIAGLNFITGITALQDGRIVFPGNVNEVFYSSHLDDAVWTVAPAGNTPLAETDNLIRAMGRMGGTLTFHHPSGIIFGDPTGLADPPLRFQASPAYIGTIAPHTLRPYLGGEAFMAADGDVKFFDGNSVTSLGDGEFGARVRQLRADEGVDPDFYAYFGWVGGGRNEYHVGRRKAGAATKFWTYQPDLNTWWPNETSVVIGAGNDNADSTTVNPSTQMTLAAASDTSGGVLKSYIEGQADSTGSPTYMVETDDLDAGSPVTEKTPMRAAVWPVATMDDLTVSVRRADEASYPAGAVVTKDPLSTNRPMWYDFAPGSTSAIAADNAHRWKLSGTTLRLGVFALLLRWKVGGEKEMVTTG